MKAKLLSSLLGLSLLVLVAGGCQENNANGGNESNSNAKEKEHLDTTSAAESSDEVRNEKQSNGKEEERLSPPDTAYASSGNWEVTVSYGAPSVRDRDIWGKLVPYDKVWRTGANEATVLKTNRPIIILGEHIPAGKYALFTIPGKGKWTIILNKVWNQWGAYEYNENEDILRVQVEPEYLNTFTEQLSFDLEKIDGQAVRLIFNWENLQFSLPIEKATAA